ncbi:hypothetical protein PR002_g1793 [Phytophthora rubi]|uniref:Uncharacterized protein n=1 Tax=Phytophthora rubi TaxID=129364 RepID=A0A6A3NXZ5_9STRA|nr:hypothetical protein PR002_g1793 [Phytophthora rubi]
MGISIGPIRRRAQRDGTDCTASAKRRRRQDRRDQDGEGVCLARALRRRVHDGAGAKNGAIRTEKVSASLARFGAKCKTAQAPRSARSGRRRRRPRSRASAPIARQRDQDGEGVGLARTLRRRLQDSAIRTEKASASLARFGADCKTARSGRRRRRPRSRASALSAGRRRRQERRDQDGEGVGLARALRRLVQDDAGAKIGAIRTDEASASIARFGAECNTA